MCWCRPSHAGVARGCGFGAVAGVVIPGLACDWGIGFQEEEEEEEDWVCDWRIVCLKKGGGGVGFCEWRIGCLKRGGFGL